MSRRPDINGRQMLLNAALKLFAAQGVDAVSIRAINREAGLGPASVHYHFGTKDALVEAVLRIHGDRIVEAVRGRAKEIVGGERSATAQDLVNMLAVPYLELISEHDSSGHDWVRLVSQLAQTDPERISDPAATRLTRQAAARTYPTTSPNTIDRALRMCFSLLVAQLALLGDPKRGRGRTGAGALDLDLLIDFLSGGLDRALTAGIPADRSSGAA
jgi:AcrR family transcriptional regulator